MWFSLLTIKEAYWNQGQVRRKEKVNQDRSEEKRKVGCRNYKNADKREREEKK